LEAAEQVEESAEEAEESGGGVRVDLGPAEG
jgi:hypothetical protein